MNIDNQFCLKWNGFHNNVISSYGELQATNDFSDVTLVGEDNQLIKAHRVILSASSPFFKSILNMNTHFYPIIYMRGLKGKNLVGIINLIYQGEAKICQDDLQSFLTLAEELQIKGVTEYINTEERQKQEQNCIETKERISIDSNKKQPKEILKEEIHSESIVYPKVAMELFSKNSMDLFANSVDSVDDENGLKMQISSMMRKEDGKTGWVCQSCGKNSTKSNIAQHIESMHMGRVLYRCTLCGKRNRSADGLRQHKLKTCH